MEVSNVIDNYTLLDKTKDFFALGKFRLASLVVFSAAVGYLIAISGLSKFNAIDFLALIIGGFLVTGSSNAFNQIWERNLDIKMDRTKNRPVAAGRLTVMEAMVFSVLIGLVGLALLFSLNMLSGILGAVAMVSYVLMYTPLKTKTPLAVFVGAIPGSIPPLLGYIAYTGEFSLPAIILFITQFFWQYPHFWAIAWKINDDYSKAGFKLLPSAEGKTKQSAFQIFFYSGMMIPIGAMPCLQLAQDVAPLCSLYALPILLGLGIMLFMPALKLYRTMDEKYAKQLMMASFIYLPVAQLTYLFL